MPPRRQGKFYVVTRGTKPGIYDSWIETRSYIKGVTDPAHQSFDTYQKALDIWREAEEKGWLERVDRPPRTSSRPLGPSSSMSAIDSLLNTFSSTSPTDTWYVVVRGRTTGIFTTWLETNRYVTGIADAVHESFPSAEKAKRVFREALIRGDVETVATFSPGSQTIRRAPSSRTEVIATPPLTPVKAEHETLPLLEEETLRPDLSSTLGRMSLNATPASSPSTYRTASPAASRPGSSRYNTPRKLMQHHSLPAAFPSSQRAQPVARSSSEHPTGQSQGSTTLYERTRQETFSEGRPERKALAAVGNPPYLQGYPTRESKRLVERGVVLSPLSSSGISLSSVDSPRVANSRSYSPPREPFASYQTTSLQVAMSAPPSPSRQSGSSTPSKRSTGTITPQMIAALQAPLPESMSPRSSYSSPSSSNSVEKGITTSPLAYDLRNGTSMLIGEQRSPRNRERKTSHTLSPSKMGLAPMHAPHSVYGSDFDPRSPASKMVSMPGSMNSASFGRPSPSVPQGSSLFA